MQQQSTAGQSSSYPHRPPSLRLESRRTSISMDDVVRRASMASVASSPDSNLLRVQAHLPGRRHSDNTIQPPRILIAPSSPTTSFSLSRGPSVAILNARRHSSIGMQDAKNFIPKVSARLCHGLIVCHLSTCAQYFFPLIPCPISKSVSYRRT